MLCVSHTLKDSGYTCLYQSDTYIYVGYISRANNLSYYADDNKPLLELIRQYLSKDGVQFLCHSIMNTTQIIEELNPYTIYTCGYINFSFKGTQFLDMKEAKKFYLKLCLV